MKKCNVYTRTGDTGQTSLVGGTRVSKCCLRLQAYGTVDELNSYLGLLLTYVSDDDRRQRLLATQRHLFAVGAALATPIEPAADAPATAATPEMPAKPHVAVSAADVEALELAIDATADGLPPWRGFTLPGGCRAAAVAHVCRTVCRRAEREICALAAAEPLPPHVLHYVNRLSDYLYVLALRLNRQAGVEETLW